MPVVRNVEMREVPWRPGYRNFVLGGANEGLTCIAGYSEIQPGAGAPLHVHHDVDEIFILLQGVMEMRLGEETLVVEVDHTVAIPAGVPHAFSVIGEIPLRMFTFMPRLHAIAEATTYFDDAAPAGAEDH